MQVIKDGRIIDDAWQSVEAEGPLPEGDIIVPYARWLREREALLCHHAGRVGVLIDGDTPVTELEPDLPRIPLVALSFPKLADGRGYSQAVMLRRRLGYRGELRAVGEVLRDQLRDMYRCGINAFVLPEGKDIEDALKAFGEFSWCYQPGFDGEPTVAERRAGPG